VEGVSEIVVPAHTVQEGGRYRLSFSGRLVGGGVWRQDWVEMVALLGDGSEQLIDLSVDTDRA
jgi:hypothetical protein